MNLLGQRVYAFKFDKYCRCIRVPIYPRPTKKVGKNKWLMTEANNIKRIPGIYFFIFIKCSHGLKIVEKCKLKANLITIMGYNRIVIILKKWAIFFYAQSLPSISNPVYSGIIFIYKNYVFMLLYLDISILYMIINFSHW